MLAVIKSCTLLGLQALPVQVEVDVSSGLPSFEIVGLPDAAVRESRERVRAALKNSGYDFPLQRITVNLAPADLKKEGSLFDLAIALGILAASGQLDADYLASWMVVGELSLDGSARPVPGVLAMAEMAAALPEKIALLVPQVNSSEAALIPNLQVFGVAGLSQAAALCSKEDPGDPVKIDPAEFWEETAAYPTGDFAEVRGQESAKRALEIAAAGGHNVILIGSPGSGKSMLARRLPGILPPPTLTEALLITKIHSAAGLLPGKQPLITTRPFRAPHHTASSASITGGGRVPKPGEVSLASLGVLFLDELPEFRRDVVEALRQPLEDRVVTVTRVTAALSYPANFILMAAMNPCPCGFLGDPVKECSCTPLQVQRYRSRVSGPVLDRIDLHVEVPRLSYQEVEAPGRLETSAEIRRRVIRAREIQAERLQETGKFTNAEMTGREIEQYVSLDQEGRQLLKTAFESLGLSMRAHDRILKVARTIADLEGSATVRASHLAEAIGYRSLDRT